MRMVARWTLALFVLSALLSAVLVASAEQARPRLLCTHRADRPDLGSPVHKQRGGEGGIVQRLKNDHAVWVLKTVGRWHRVQFSEKGPSPRTEPRRYTGWIHDRYLKACVLRMLGSGGDGGASPDILSADGLTMSSDEHEAEVAKVRALAKEMAKTPPSPSPAKSRSTLDAVVTNIEGVKVAGRKGAFRVSGIYGKLPPGKVTLSKRDRPLKACWWNAKSLGHGKRDWRATARAVKGCDVVGLGEVMTATAPDKLVSHMPEGWKALTSSKSVGRSKRYREYYAVVYDSSRVKVVPDGVAGFYPDPGDRFAREPWAVTLKAGSFDFTLALLRVTSGKSARERVAELAATDDAFEWFQEEDAEEDDIVLMGDFNRTPKQRGWEEVLGAGLKLLVAGKGTTVSAKGARLNLYDQIVIDPQETAEWTGKAGVLEKVGIGMRVFRERVSDHLPVWATFGVGREGDD